MGKVISPEKMAFISRVTILAIPTSHSELEEIEKLREKLENGDEIRIENEKLSAKLRLLLIEISCDLTVQLPWEK